MDKKITVILLVAVIVVAGMGVAAVVINNGQDSKEVKATGNLPVFGNANNDDYIDSRDIDLMEKLIADESLDRSAYPFLDANQDGELDSADIEIVKKVIDKKACDLHYSH